MGVWAYGRYEYETIPDKNHYQLVIEVEPETLKNYALTWRIGIDGERYVRTCGRNCLMSDYNQLPNDVEEWEVQGGWRLDSSSAKTIIGTFRMLKK